MSDQRFLPQHHVRRQADFQRVYGCRCRASDDRLLVFGCPNGLPYPRLGLSVSRKLGGAVLRNRHKRLIREAFRLSREQLPVGIDLIVIPRHTAKPELAPLLNSLPKLAARVARQLGNR